MSLRGNEIKKDYNKLDSFCMEQKSDFRQEKKDTKNQESLMYKRNFYLNRIQHSV